MLTKLSIRNVKRSFSDYTIYFLTLTFGVSLFYSFNSISAQEMMLELSGIQKGWLDYMTKYMGFISIFISVILAFLILYANQFLVKRRKKELGLYQTLGMSKFNISRLFMLETFVIGLISLISGLVLGTVISQGFSILVSSLFDAEILAYKFIFSFEAMFKTILYFSIMFLIVMVFNTVVISRFTLLELLYGSNKNDALKIQNLKVTLGLFVISTSMIIAGYIGLTYFSLTNGILYPILFGSFIVIGTCIWFYSLAGFTLNVLQKRKSVYFKELNMFLVRQLNSKVNTNFISMIIICFMLTGTITILSSGFGYKKAMDEELKLVTPYDVTLTENLWIEEPIKEPKQIETMLNSHKIGIEELGNYLELFIYHAPFDTPKLLEPYITPEQSLSYFGSGGDLFVSVLKQSDYEKIAKLQNITPLEMDKNEVILQTNMKNMVGILQQVINDNSGLTIDGKQYTFANKKPQLMSIENTEVPRDEIRVVLPDEDAMKFEQRQEILVANYTKDAKKINEKLMDLYHYKLSPEYSDSNFVLPYTKNYVYEQSQGQTGTIIFIGIYMGLIFLLSSAAILTLQQLSEASDNLSRYRILKRIGVTQASIHSVIFKQVLIYFMLPLVVAMGHSIVIVSIISKVASETSNFSIIGPALWTSGILLVVYGGYFFATYKSYKSIVK